MLTRTTTRRSAVVLTVALVAMLLVALGGSARAGQHRASAGTGHSLAGAQPGRHTAAVQLAPHDHTPWHLDLASTPPDDAASRADSVALTVEALDTTIVTHETIAAVGRAPPAP